MSSVYAVTNVPDQNIAYALTHDKNRTGGGRSQAQRAANTGRDTATISDAGKLLSAQNAVRRDEHPMGPSARGHHSTSHAADSEPKPGNGNDLIEIADDTSSTSTQTGGGNDTIKIGKSSFSVVDGGVGDDMITIDYAEASHIAGGEGDDMLDIAEANMSIITGDAPKNDPWLELQSLLGGTNLKDMFAAFWKSKQDKAEDTALAAVDKKQGETPVA